MKITIIGSGNVGAALAVNLKKAGHAIHEIAGRNRKTVLSLAKKVKAKPVFRIKNISPESDLYIIAVDDSNITTIVNQFPFINKAVVHTSGATDSKLINKFKQFGILYPVNSVSTAAFSFIGTPFCLHASDKKLVTLLNSLIKDLKGKSYLINDDQRLLIHLAAVFANNFSNALYQASFDILQRKKIPFAILEPIILSTASNVIGKKPSLVQTGPAAREDQLTLEKHLSLLKNNPDLKKVYQLMSGLIKKNK